jgi:hypothetical protein
MTRAKLLPPSATSARAAGAVLVIAGLYAVSAGAVPPPSATPPARNAKAVRPAISAKSPGRPVTSPYARAAEHQARAPQAVGGQSRTAAQAHSPRAPAKRH